MNQNAEATPIWMGIHESLQQLLSEQGRDLGEIGRSTALIVDLGLQSTDLIHLLITLEDRLEVPLQFDELATDENGDIRDDLTIGDLYDFLDARLADRIRTADSATSCA